GKLLVSANGSSKTRATSGNNARACELVKTSSWCSVPSVRATVAAWERSSYDGSAKPIANVLTGTVDTSAARAVTRLESIPPERKVPQGTSHLVRQCTDARSRVRIPGAASSAVGCASVVVGGRGGAQER